MNLGKAFLKFYYWWRWHILPLWNLLWFEAMLKPVEVETYENKQLNITMEHVPVSVSILSNVQGYDMKSIFFCNNQPEILIDEFVKTLYLMIKQKQFIRKI